MKSIRNIALGVILAIGAFSAVIYSSCSKTDACASITCKNSGTCSGGVCTCTTGYGDSLCAEQIRSVLAYTFKGDGTSTFNGSTDYTFPGSTITFTNPGDNNWTQMTAKISELDHSSGIVTDLGKTFSVVLTNPAIPGTISFVISPINLTTVTGTISGTGTIVTASAGKGTLSASTVTLTLTWSYDDGLGGTNVDIHTYTMMMKQ